MNSEVEGVIAALEYIPTLKDYINANWDAATEMKDSQTYHANAMFQLKLQESWLLSQAKFNFECGDDFGDFDKDRWTLEYIEGELERSHREVQEARAELERQQRIDLQEQIQEVVRLHRADKNDMIPLVTDLPLNYVTTVLDTHFCR
jgi:hypothetical protein